MMKGISTVIATLLMLVITISLLGIAYGYITGLFKSQILGPQVEVDDTRTSCSGTTITVYIKNIGAEASNTDQVTLSGTNSEGGAIATTACAGAGVGTVLAAGGNAVQCSNTLTGTTGFNTVEATAHGKTDTSIITCT